MSVSGEGAALRSARTWLLLLCPEIPDRSGGKGAERLRLVVRRQGAWAGRKGAMEWRMALLGSNMASLGHTRGETHKGGSKGPFLTRIGASSARVRARLALHAPTPAFGRRRSRPLADRGLRPPSTVDRGLRPPPQIAGSRSMRHAHLRFLFAHLVQQVFESTTHGSNQDWHTFS